MIKGKFSPHDFIQTDMFIPEEYSKLLKIAKQENFQGYKNPILILKNPRTNEGYIYKGNNRNAVAKILKFKPEYLILQSQEEFNKIPPEFLDNFREDLLPKNTTFSNALETLIQNSKIFSEEFD